MHGTNPFWAIQLRWTSMINFVVHGCIWMHDKCPWALLHLGAWRTTSCMDASGNVRMHGSWLYGALASIDFSIGNVVRNQFNWNRLFANWVQWWCYFIDFRIKLLILSNNLILTFVFIKVVWHFSLIYYCNIFRIPENNFFLFDRIYYDLLLIKLLWLNSHDWINKFNLLWAALKG